MQQSNFIFGALAVAFVVFITSRGSLPTYMSVLFGTAAAPSSDPKNAKGESIPDVSSGSSITGMAGSLLGGILGGVQ
jgi:hypothetical protein